MDTTTLKSNFDGGLTFNHLLLMRPAKCSMFPWDRWSLKPNRGILDVVQDLCFVLNVWLVGLFLHS